MTGPVAFATRLLRDERVRFLLIGGTNTVAGYGLFVLYEWLFGRWISYFGSLLLSHLCASLVAFALYRHWVFRVRGNVVLDFLRFQLVYLIPLLSNLLALPLLIELLHIWVYAAQAIIVVASSLLSYVGHKFFSFRRRIDPLGDPLTAEAPSEEAP